MSDSSYQQICLHAYKFRFYMSHVVLLGIECHGVAYMLTDF